MVLIDLIFVKEIHGGHNLVTVLQAPFLPVQRWVTRIVDCRHNISVDKQAD